MTTEQIGDETWCTNCGRRAWLCERHPCAVEEAAEIVETKRPRLRAWRLREERAAEQGLTKRERW